MLNRLDRNYKLTIPLLVVTAIVVNMVIGQLVQYVFGWPLYLDSIGTIVVGALLGPLAGAATGAATNLLWSLIRGDWSIAPYAVTAALIGWAAGFAASKGAFERFWTALLAGFLTGVMAAIVSAPITAYLFGGVTGAGTDYVTGIFAATSDNILQAASLQGLISDPIDKTLSFAIAWVIWRYLAAHFHHLTSVTVEKMESLKGYGGAIALSVAALAISWIFLPAFGSSVFAIFYVAVIISAWRGGLGPGLVAMAVGLLANILLLIPPFGHMGLGIQNWLDILLFLIVSVLLAFITAARERAYRALDEALHEQRRSQARIRAVVDSVADALVLVAPDGRFSIVNRAFEEMLGVPAEDIRDHTLEEVGNLLDRAFPALKGTHATIVDAAADQERQFTQVLKQEWPAPRDLGLFSTPVFSGEEYLGRLYVFRDITREREVDRMKTEFVSMVSHELRTPLTSIKGFTDLILDGDAGEVDEEQREYLEIVQKNADRLLGLINDLLDISRIESGRVHLKIEPVSLQEIVSLVVATMQPQLETKDQPLSVEIDPAATQVMGDRDKLVQVLTNLVSNAHKYSPAGRPIRIQVTRQDDFARVAVIDQGFGISAEDQAKLFTRFFRVENSLTREIGGTGLGLNIVKSIVELHGGGISVVSRPGEGSTFAFTVPLAKAEESVTEEPAEGPPATPEPEEAVPAPTAATPAITPGGVRSVLVVEDDADIARLIERHLESAGYEVDVAASAEQALQILQWITPDLITLDLQLPGMDGFEFAARLAENPETRHIPVLALSVLQDEERDAAVGILKSLPKPIDRQGLLDTVAEMLTEEDMRKILVVEDDPDVTRLLQTALARQELDVLSAGDGETGLRMAGQEHPGLILLDLHLPGMDGFAVLRQLKQTPAIDEIPVIVMTGSEGLNPETRAKALSLGAADFITKPFRLDQLVEEIKLFVHHE
jgi:PAS domain S-box-containing protein